VPVVLTFAPVPPAVPANCTALWWPQGVRAINNTGTPGWWTPSRFEKQLAEQLRVDLLLVPVLSTPWQCGNACRDLLKGARGDALLVVPRGWRPRPGSDRRTVYAHGGSWVFSSPFTGACIASGSEVVASLGPAVNCGASASSHRQLAKIWPAIVLYLAQLHGFMVGEGSCSTCFTAPQTMRYSSCACCRWIPLTGHAAGQPPGRPGAFD
jgi:hypothetical protein